MIISLSFGLKMSAQDPNYSQFFMNDLYYNPGLTGINDGIRVGTIYRNLWGPIPSKFNTGSVSLDGSGINKVGLGLIATTDIEGEGGLRTHNIAGNYSYRFLESRNFRLQWGVQGQYVRKQIDWTQLVFSDQLDAVFGQINSSEFILPSNNIQQYVDFGSGVAVRFNIGNAEGKNGKKMTGTFGMAMHHITQPKDAFIGGGYNVLPRKLTLHGELKIASPTVLLAPAFIYENQSNLSTFSGGLNFAKMNMFAGFWFRNQQFAFLSQKFDSFIFNFGISKKTAKENKFKFCYSYDFTISRLKTSAYGTHELSMIMEWNNKVLFKKRAARKAKKNKYRFIPCTDYSEY